MFTFNENGQLVVEVTRPNGMAYKFEFEPKTEFISDNNCCILRKTAIHRMVTELQIEVSEPDIKPISNTMVIVRAAKIGERVEYAIGEASDKSLESDIAKKYPILTADNRAYQRAVLQVLGLAGRVYGEDEMRSDPFAVPQGESYENSSVSQKRDTSVKTSSNKKETATDGNSGTSCQSSDYSKKNSQNAQPEPEESYESVQEEAPKKRGRPPKNKPAEESYDAYEEESYEAVQEPPRNASVKKETAKPTPKPSSPPKESVRETPADTASVSFTVRPEHTEKYPWLTQEAADDCLKVDPYSTPINVGRVKGKNIPAYDLMIQGDPTFEWILGKNILGSNAAYDDSIRAARAAIIHSIMEEEG